MWCIKHLLISGEELSKLQTSTKTRQYMSPPHVHTTRHINIQHKQRERFSSGEVREMVWQDQGRLSLASSLQYSLIFSKRYFFLSGESPCGVIWGGLSAGDGVHTPRNSTRLSSSATVDFLRKTTPGWSRSKRK